MKMMIDEYCLGKRCKIKLFHAEDEVGIVSSFDNKYLVIRTPRCYLIPFKQIQTIEVLD